MSHNKLEMLQNSWLLGVLPELDIKRLLQPSNQLRLPENKLIFSKGDIADCVYIILEGEISIEIIASDGRSISLAILSRGDIFGELAVLDEGVRSANARSLGEATILKIAKPTFINMAMSNPKFSYAIIRELIGRLRTTDTQIENVTFKPLKTRLALQLMTLTQNQHEKAEKVLKITQSELAERLCATREKVNVNLQKLQRAGAISLGRGRIEVLDIGQLESIATE